MFLAVFILIFTPSVVIGQNNNPFVVVIDAGHGGKDPGAIGSFSREKNLNLDIALKLGKLITDHTDATDIYTRKSDVFVELNERAAIANRSKANLFISIHTNALKSKSYSGTETYSLGLARSEENLEVAKRENAVILLEDNYSTRYEGFDPNSTESYIIFEMMQGQYMEQSINLASYVQRNFASQCKRINRGVKQAGFLVLRNTSMPSILIEIGYISNRAEERYLNTESGKKAISSSIYNAFVEYKEDYEKKLNGKITQRAEMISVDNEETEVAEDPVETIKTTETTAVSKSRSTETKKNETIYKIQIIASVKPLKKNSSEFKGLKNVDYFKDKKWYKYTYGATSDYNEIKSLKKKMVDKKFKNAFIISFKNGKLLN
ncbi:MAG: N-acetylmuramoyl-L-alanine amidase [Bacteroidales bacterium]|nr:N-acetylmuramoyl-L-alanine amidase [Bacteroidales bacterium]